MTRRMLVGLLLCAPLALPGCGVVESSARDAVAKLMGGGDQERAAADPAAGPGEAFTIAADEDAADEVAAEDDGGHGFYKIVEPNGTIRFTANLSDVPVEQRPKAERLALAPSRPGKSASRAPSRRELKQIATAAEAPGAPAAIAPAGGREVVIYTTSWCGWCRKTRAWLDAKGVEYENKDVEADPDAGAEMRELTGGDGGVPVVVIDGQVVRGFNERRMQELLRI